jgi:hypothetical protein
MQRFQSSAQLASALTHALKAAVESPDLCQIEAVHEIIDQERYQGLDGLCREIEHNPVTFILEAAPAFEAALACATGHRREEWASRLP